jgi:hypothetical protein
VSNRLHTTNWSMALRGPSLRALIAAEMADASCGEYPNLASSFCSAHGTFTHKGNVLYYYIYKYAYKTRQNVGKNQPKSGKLEKIQKNCAKFHSISFSRILDHSRPSFTAILHPPANISKIVWCNATENS